MTGRVINAEEALRHGLVDGIHDPALDKALDTARLIAANAPLAIQTAKELLNRALQGDHELNLAQEAEELGRIFATQDAREGCLAFVEKRQPDFAGR